VRYKELYFGCNYYILITFDSKIMKINTGKNIDEKLAIIAFSDKGPDIVILLNKKKLLPFQLSK
jgi:hypothetical protein